MMMAANGPFRFEWNRQISAGGPFPLGAGKSRKHFHYNLHCCASLELFRPDVEPQMNHQSKHLSLKVTLIGTEAG